MKKILVIRFSSLGDVILTTVLYPNIKKKWPDSELTVLTKPPFSSVLTGNPDVDHVRLFDPRVQTFSQLCKELRLESYDVVIDLQNNIRSWFIRFITATPLTLAVKKVSLARHILIWTKRAPSVLERSVLDRIGDCLEPLEIEKVDTETHLYPQAVERVGQTFSLDPQWQYIAIAPGSKHKTKQWAPQNFAEAANRLGATPNTKILLLGDERDKGVASEMARHIRVPFMNLTGWTTVSELVTITSLCKFLLTNDSALLHIGEALSIPLVALFGPTVRKFGFAPYRKTSRVVEVVNLKCRPCSLHGDEVCPLKHHKCMKDIDVNAVMMAASMVLEKETDENTSLK